MQKGNRLYQTTLSRDHLLGEKYIDTKDWGLFKIRKNGKVHLSIEGEIVRATPLEEPHVQGK